MSDRLTPEREAEIRRWNAGMIEANPECADECEYADFGDCEVCTPRVLLAALDACRRDLAEARAETDGPSGLREQLDAARKGEQIERRLREQAERDLAEERARTTRLTEALERLASMEGFDGPGYVGGDSVAERELRARGFYAERMLAECGAGTEQPA